MIYVLALNDWEDYKPYYFECDCSKEEFHEAVEQVMLKVGLHLSKKHDSYIDGYDMLNLAVRVLSRRGFKRIRFDYEITMTGMCLYHDKKDRPEIIPYAAWKAIIEHNEEVNKKLYGHDEEDDEETQGEHNED